MAITETLQPPPSHIPTADELRELAASEALVLFPDTVSEVSGEQVAGFRDNAQALRVRAGEEGIPVQLVLPERSRPGIYAEHDAVLVLAYVLGVASNAVGQLIANEIQRRIDEHRNGAATDLPTVRVREIEVNEESGTTQVREIEGPADEIVDFLTERERPRLDAGTEESG